MRIASIITLSIIALLIGGAVAQAEVPTSPTIRPFAGVTIDKDPVIGVAYELSLYRVPANDLTFSLEGGLCALGSISQFDLSSVSGGPTVSIQVYKDDKNLGVGIGWTPQSKLFVRYNPVTLTW